MKKIITVLLIALSVACKPQTEPEPDPTPTPVPTDKTKISSAAEFAEFLKTVKETDKSTYKITASFDCTGVTLDAASKFSGTLDGQGNTISGINSNKPLFTNLSGTIQNLKINGKITASAKDVSSLVMNNNGQILNCTNLASVSLKLSGNQTDSHVIGGLVAYNRGQIKDSDNQGAVSVTSTGKLCATALGGIAAYSTGKLEGCTNTGELSIEAPSVLKLTAIADVSQSAISAGGIVGLAFSGFEASRCTNKGRLRLSFNKIDEMTQAVERNQIGGIVGSSSGNLTSCTNSGELNVSATSSDRAECTSNSFLVCVGGISGGDWSAPDQNVTNISDCSNSGAINADLDWAGSNNTVGGIVGWPNKEAIVDNITSNCSNTGAITISGKGKVRAGGIQGGTGNIDKCTNSGTVTVKNSASTSTIGGIAAFHSRNHILKDCTSTGDVISEVAIAGAAALVGNHGNAVTVTGDGCKINCRVKNIDSAFKCTGMVVGLWNGTSSAVTLGSLASPIKLEGQISGGSTFVAIDDYNFSNYLSGSNNSSDSHSIVTDRNIPTGGKISGHVTWSDGSPAGGVAVSDGFTVVYTDKQGGYNFDASPDACWIYISTPSDAAVTKNSDGNPDFYIKYANTVSSYDFVLTRQEIETKFAIFALADPQAHYSARSPQTVADVNRFRDETVPALNTQSAALGIPCYGITLGDVVYSEGSRNSNPGMETMRSNFAKLSMPVFQTMGNHDYTYFGSSSALITDATASTLYLKAQRKFETTFGPVNHSFNRGKVHFVCMRDVNYDSGTDASDYHGGFSNAQYEWLKQDLTGVPTDYAVVLCVHIPIVGLSGKENVSNVLNLIKKYPNSTVFSGHTHYKRGVANVLSSGMYEHVHSAVCGQWWWSNIEGDGCPNGYTAYTFEGNKIVDEFFCGVNTHMNTKDYQMRLYRGNAKCGGPYAYFQWPHSSNVLLINLFNGDSRWTVKVYEDGALSGTATVMPFSKKTWSSVTKGSTYTVPESSSQDWWTIGYNIGVVGRGTSSTSYYTGNYHMYKYTLKNASSQVKVEAIDPYGNIYTCTDIISDGTSYPEYVKVGNH